MGRDPDNFERLPGRVAGRRSYGTAHETEDFL